MAKHQYMPKTQAFNNFDPQVVKTVLTKFGVDCSKSVGGVN